MKQMNKFQIGLLGMCLFLTHAQLLAQHPWATAVDEYSFGTSQIFGQDSTFFPANVLGPVGPAVSETTPASTPSEIVSLGKGGYVVLSFDYPLIDGPGPDFTVFENAFVYPGGIFDEWMIVSVSVDGENWLVFPHDTLTGAGMAGRTPTTGGADYLNPAESGGDSFDLADLGLDTARYVRVTDATHYQGLDRLSAELDAVIALHTVPVGLHDPLPAEVRMQQVGNEWRVFVGEDTEVRLIGLNGRMLHGSLLTRSRPLRYATEGLATGVYVWILQDRNGVYVRKWRY